MEKAGEVRRIMLKDARFLLVEGACSECEEVKELG